MTWVATFFTGLILFIGSVVGGVSGLFGHTSNSIPAPVTASTTRSAADTQQLTILYPSNGVVLHQDRQVTVKWNVSQSLLDSVPPDFTAYVYMIARRQNDGQGVPNTVIVGGIAQNRQAVWDLSRASWDTAGAKTVSLDSGTYILSADFEVEPKDMSRMCAKAIGKDCYPDDAATTVFKQFANIKAADVTFQISAAD